MGLGVFHSGVAVHGREITFGGNESDESGVYEHPVGRPMGGAPLPLRSRIRLGSTSLSWSQVSETMMAMGREYRARSYNLLRRNCNHFTDDFCRRIIGVGIPGFVNR